MSNPRKSARKLTDYLCQACRECNVKNLPHPGVRHQPGICDCPCRDQ